MNLFEEIGYLFGATWCPADSQHDAERVSKLVARGSNRVFDPGPPPSWRIVQSELVEAISAPVAPGESSGYRDILEEVWDKSGYCRDCNGVFLSPKLREQGLSADVWPWRDAQTVWHMAAQELLRRRGR